MTEETQRPLHNAAIYTSPHGAQPHNQTFTFEVSISQTTGLLDQPDYPRITPEEYAKLSGWKLLKTYRRKIETTHTEIRDRELRELRVHKW